MGYRIRLIRDNGTEDLLERPGEPAFFNTYEEAEDYRIRTEASLGVASRGNPFGSGGHIQRLEVYECEK